MSAAVHFRASSCAESVCLRVRKSEDRAGSGRSHDLERVVFGASVVRFPAGCCALHHPPSGHWTLGRLLER